MCGIVGMISTSGLTDWAAKRTWLEKALYVDTLRGDHSTGICAILTKDMQNPIIYKRAIAGYDFIQLKATEILLSNVNDYDCVIGHNRAATRGAINDKNAHPFQHNHISLVHNGTLRTRNGISSALEVDSEAVTLAIAEDGASVVLPKLNGAYALVWYNAEEQTINLARNNERPLHFAFSKDNRNMFFASEAWMIRHLVPTVFGVDKVFSLKVGVHMTINTLNEDLSAYTATEFEVYEPPVSKAYTWPYETTHYSSKNTGAKAKAESKFKDHAEQFGYQWRNSIVFTIEKFEGYSGGKTQAGTLVGLVSDGNTTGDIVKAYAIPSKVMAGGNQDTKYIGIIEDVYYSPHEQSVVVRVLDVKQYVSLSLPSPEDGDEESVINTVIGPGNKLVTEKYFNELTKHGCCFCQQNIFVEDAEDIEWTTGDQPICEDCADVSLNGMGVNKH